MYCGILWVMHFPLIAVYYQMDVSGVWSRITFVSRFDKSITGIPRVTSMPDDNVHVDVEVEVEVEPDELEIEVGDTTAAEAELEADGVTAEIELEIDIEDGSSEYED